MRRVIYFFIFLFSPNEQRARGGRGAARLFLFLFFPCSAVVFGGLATNALNVRNYNNNNRFFFKQQLNPKYDDTVPLCLKIREAMDGNGTGDIWGTTVRNKRVFFWIRLLLRS